MVRVGLPRPHLGGSSEQQQLVTPGTAGLNTQHVFILAMAVVLFLANLNH